MSGTVERSGRQHGAQHPTSMLLQRQAPDGAVWPHCGHPKTPENTRTKHGQRGLQQCRACNRRRALSYIHKKRGKA